MLFTTGHILLTQNDYIVHKHAHCTDVETKCTPDKHNFKTDSQIFD